MYIRIYIKMPNVYRHIGIEMGYVCSDISINMAFF